MMVEAIGGPKSFGGPLNIRETTGLLISLQDNIVRRYGFTQCPNSG